MTIPFDNLLKGEVISYVSSGMLSAYKEKEFKNEESYASNGMLSAYKEKEFKNEESYVSSLQRD